MPNFLHIADLHHARHTGNAIHAERTSFDIQRDKLQQLASVIREHEIAAVLIAGDIEVSDSYDLMPYLKELTSLGASIYIVFGEHDVNRHRDKEVWETVPNVHCFVEPGYRFDPALGVGIYGISCTSNQAGLGEALDHIPPLELTHPNLLLSHGRASAFSNTRLHPHAFAYVALGDHHRYEVMERLNTTIVYPGHLFSVWDGCGKAWETGYVIGSIDGDTITHTFHVFQGAQTRRVCVNPFIRNDDQIQLILDNVPSMYEQWVKDDPVSIQEVIRQILRTYPDDYFVTPSHAKLRPRRMCMRGQRLLDDPILLESFVQRCYKATPNTQ
ncbi:metallophosphoesterase family protein [Exiguobacterium aestuarii]|uniref:metallophosphoesterase family protein n=1 Tax=Exiguobacterium aestuarii TaxID=273527 RepID=UPI001CD35C69|nr:metallophosphoesterase family protein [Exiguobacterium aestuarii]MCA0981230.1 metallophosphoesterase family protein [Exiguobacterium aestuarii]